MFHSVYVKAHFRESLVDEEIDVPTGGYRRNILGIKKALTKTKLRKKRIVSDTEIDGFRLAKDLAEATLRLEKSGYDVVNVFPVSSGRYDHRWEMFRDGGAGYGYGYSYTSGIVILAKRPGIYQEEFRESGNLEVNPIQPKSEEQIQPGLGAVFSPQGLDVNGIAIGESERGEEEGISPQMVVKTSWYHTVGTFSYILFALGGVCLLGPMAFSFLLMFASGLLKPFGTEIDTFPVGFYDNGELAWGALFLGMGWLLETARK